MSFSIGIVGLPNVGKSTLFQALTKKQVDTSNYPFATIDPNVGVVAVPDARLTELARVSKSAKIVATTIEFIDIAGLVKGAAKGEGLGNKFLSHIREVNAICHIVRAFEDKTVTHVAGRISPLEDEKTVLYELAMADLEQISRALAAFSDRVKAGDEKSAKKTAVLERAKAILDRGELLSKTDWTDEEKALMKPFNFLTLKPILTVYNVAEKESWAETSGISICAKVESDIAALAPDEAPHYLEALGWSESGLDKVIRKSYALLNLITFFTSGEKETHAWTITRGTPARQAAGVIHSDFEQYFIRVEIINWQDFFHAGSEAGAKSAGKMHLEGKEYIMKDGDVAYFRIAGSKK